MRWIAGAMANAWDLTAESTRSVPPARVLLQDTEQKPFCRLNTPPSYCICRIAVNENIEQFLLETISFAHVSPHTPCKVRLYGA